MLFEYDPAKSSANKLKHGIDFEEAKALWDDDLLLVAPTRFVSEKRHLAIGRIGDKMWTAVFTCRSGIVRIISVRRSRKEEVEHYEA